MDDADGASGRNGRTGCPLARVLDRIDAHRVRGAVHLTLDPDGVVVGTNGQYHP